MNCHCKLTWTGWVHDCTCVVMHLLPMLYAFYISLKWWERLSTGEGQLAFKGKGAPPALPPPKWNTLADSRIATKLGSFTVNNEVCLLCYAAKNCNLCLCAFKGTFDKLTSLNEFEFKTTIMHYPSLKTNTKLPQLPVYCPHALHSVSHLNRW